MATYNHQQTIFCLSMLANRPTSFAGDSCEIANQSNDSLTQTLNKSEVISLIGEWEIVWGFGIFQKFPRHKNIADNAMYVAQNKSTPNEYVIGIAGTNPSSWYAWFVEDFYVSQMVQWPYSSAHGLTAKISKGSAIGLNHLQEMTPCPGLAGENTTIYTFLSQIVANSSSTENIKIITTGHSLGGTLSPTLALWLQDTKSEWDPDNKSSITCYPFAGLTAGNKDFVSYSDNTLKGNCIRNWNELDIVPHAWNTEQLKQIPSLYRPEIGSNLYITLMVEIALLNSHGHYYTQINQNAAPLPGAKLGPIDPSQDNFQQFLAQVGFQHFPNYFKQLEVEEFWPFIWEIDGVTVDKDMIAALSDPALSLPPKDEIDKLKTVLEKFKKDQQKI